MDFSHISSYLSSDSRSGWREKLLEASFRGVPFKVEEESAGSGGFCRIGCRQAVAGGYLGTSAAAIVRQKFR